MLTLRVSDPDPIVLGLGEEQEAVLTAEPVVYVSIADYYEGPYTVTPGTEAVMLETDGYTMTEDVTVQAVPVGSEGVPVATKSAVSNHQIAVTPSVTNAAGLIEGGTRTGASVTVSASELVSGTKSINANGSGIDVTDFQAVNVSVPNTYTAQDEGKVISSGALVPQTSATYTQNGEYDTTLINDVTVAVPPEEPVLQTKTETYTPTEEAISDAILPAPGYDGLGEVDITVSAIPSNYVGSGIPRKDSSNLTASGATVTAPAGYYSAAASKSVASGTTGTPIATKVIVSEDVAAVITPSVTNSTGYITGGTKTGSNVVVNARELVSGNTLTCDSAGTWDVAELETFEVPAGSIIQGHINGDFGDENSTRVWYPRFDFEAYGHFSGFDSFSNMGYYLAVPSNTTITPTESTQTVGGNGYMMEDAVTVSAIPSNYVGSGITRRDSTDLTASGATVTAPAGYYSASASKAVASGTEGTPTATKSAVSNHALTVTPSVTNGAGYISGGTHSGTAVSVTAAELESGTKSITANGTGIDVTGYAAVDVAVPSSSPSLQTKSASYTPSTSQQTASITPDAGFDGLDAVNITVSAMPSGSARPAATITGTAATVSTGTNTLTLTKTVSNTPQVTAGYVASGTAGNSSVSLTASVTTQAAQTIYPSGSDQTIASARYLTGTQTIKAVTTANLTAENIKNGVTVTVGDSADADRVLSVTGTYTGGGGGNSKNAQVVQQGNTRIASTTYSKACGDITVSKTGTYDVYWTAYRTSTSGTWGTQLYISGVAYGSAQATFSSYYQTVHLSNVSLTANQTVSVYGRSRGSNYYLYVGQLTIIEA